LNISNRKVNSSTRYAVSETFGDAENGRTTEPATTSETQRKPKAEITSPTAESTATAE
jgi:hypothetical protein